MSSETKSKPSTTQTNKKIVENGNLMDNMKKFFYANYKTERTVIIYTVIMMFELSYMISKTIDAKKTIVLFPYSLALISVTILLFGIRKKIQKCIVQFKYSFAVFLAYYFFSLMFAVFSILVISLLLYVYRDEKPAEGVTIASVLKTLFNVYGIFQIFLYFGYYAVTYSYIKDITEIKKTKKN